jgi:hypothetical protein
MFGKLIMPERDEDGKLIPFTAKVVDDLNWENEKMGKALQYGQHD